MKTTVKLVGMREIEQKLALVKASTAKNKMRKVLKEAGEPIARKARSLAPVSSAPYYIGPKGKRFLASPGWLRDSIDVGVKLNRSQRSQSPKGSFADLEIHIGPSESAKANAQEYGTSKQAAHPFMRPAWEGLKMKTLDTIGALAWASVNKAAR